MHLWGMAGLPAACIMHVLHMHARSHRRLARACSMQALHMRAHSHRRLAGGSGALRVVMGLFGATGVGTQFEK